MGKVLPSLFEGTFMFVIVALALMFIFKKDAFKDWMIFVPVLAVVHTAFMLFAIDFEWVIALTLLVFQALFAFGSIKLVDMFIK